MFPQLFALLGDDARSGEWTTAGVYSEALDECWLCGRCELRCPAELGISRQVIRVRMSNADGGHPQDWLLSRPQEVGRWGALVAPLSNAVLRSKTLRRWSERFTGIDHRAVPPRLQRQAFRRRKNEGGMRKDEGGGPRHEVHPSSSTLHPSRRVAYFAGCHVDHYGAQVGRAAVAVLERNGVEVICPEFRCCGMPQLSAGAGDRAEANARFNVERFGSFVEAGCEIVATCATCSLALKYHYPEFWPSAASSTLAQHTWDLFSYLKAMHDEGDLDLGFRPLPRDVRYHYPCHARYQRYGNHVTDLLRLIPELKIDFAATACCGMGGTHGFKRRHYDQSQQQAAETLAFLERANPDCVVSDCPMCVHRIGQRSDIETLHPIELFSEAYKS